MAVAKIRPFEEKGEKGFRDTVILLTILEEMKVKRFKQALFITKDQIFEHDDVKKLVQKYNVNIQVINSFDQTTEYINKLLDIEVKNFIDSENKKLLDFLNGHFETIANFIIENATVSEDFITKGGIFSQHTEVFGKIKSVLEFKPLSITSAFDEPPGLRENIKLPKDIKAIIISVKVKLKFIYAPTLLWNRPMVKIQDLGNFEEAVNTVPSRYYGDPIEKEIDRYVSVSALVKKDAAGNYTELKLKNANTF